MNNRSSFLVMLVLLTSMLAQNAKGLPGFLGSGTLADPYKISSVTYLALLANNVNAGTNYSGVFFQQTVDLDLNVSPYNTGTGWPCIGNDSYKFSGTYDGNGFKINNLFINNTTLSNGVGLFGGYMNGTIKNLGLENVNITSTKNGIGAVTGWTFPGATVQNCYVSSGTISGYSYVAGICGSPYTGSTITQCYTTGLTITGHDMVGGVGGYSYGSTINNCYSSSSIVATGSVAGGLLGYNNSTGTVDKCYSTGTVSAPSSKGGLLGGQGASATTTNSFWDTQTSGASSSSGGTGYTTSVMKTQTTFTDAGWDFTTTPIWHINSANNNGYPHLASQVFPLIVPIIASFNPASGIVGSSVTITGSNFNTSAANNTVYFGATKASVTAASATSLTVTVPAGSSFQNFSVTDLSTGLTAYSAKPFITTFTSGQVIDANSFAARVNFAANGTGNIGLAVGDLDGDGKPDVVVPSRDANTISVFLNNGTSGNVSFATKIDYATGTLPCGVRVVDLDGDGKLDIAVANLTANSISVFLNTSTLGSISFTAKSDFTIGSSGWDVDFADIDGDGKADLISAGGICISVLLNTSTVGSISFATKMDYAASDANNIATGDIDGDGKPDVVISNASANIISVYRNTSTIGSISLDARVNYTSAAYARGVAIGDMDGDGKQEVATSTNTGKAISVFKNSSTIGTISLDAKVDYTLSSSGNCVAFTDLDGDGKIDVLGGSSVVDIFKNNSISGTISLAAIQSFTSNAGVYTIRVADFDGDGRPDIATPNWGGIGFSVMRNIMLAPLNTAPTANAATSITSSGFVANWTTLANADKYLLDVATDDAFTSMIPDFSNRDVDNVTTFTLTGLDANTNYYYRIRGYNGTTSPSSSTITAATKSNQTITFGALSPVTYGDADFDPAATISSGLTITYTSGDNLIATIVGNKVHIVKVGTVTIYADQGGNASYSAASQKNQSLTISAKALTITGVTAAAKEYNGTNTAILNGGSVATGVGTETLTITAGTGTFADENVGSKVVTAAGYVLANGSNGGLSANYSLSAQPVIANQNITPKSLTVAGSTAANKTFDGELTAVLSGGSLLGVLEADDVSLATYTAGTFADKNVATGITVTSVMTLTGTKASNYSIVQPTLTASITAKELTVTDAVVTTKVYDGTKDATISGATLSGTVPGYNVALETSTTGTFAAAGVGTGISVTPVMTITGGQADNYSLTQPVLLGNITTKELTVADAVAQDKIYDGNTYAVISGATLVGVVGDEDVQLDALVGTFADKNAANSVAVTPSLTIKGSDLANYTFTQPTSLAANITAKELSVDGAIALDKVYDGIADAAIVEASLIGVVSEEDVQIDALNASFDDVNVAQSIDVTTAITLKGADLANYTLAQPVGLTADITAKELTVTGAVAKNKVYDGNATAVIDEALLVGKAGEDDVALEFLSGTFADINVANTLAVTPALTLKGITRTNYTLTQPTGLTANITKAALTVTAQNASRKEGIANEAFVIEYSGFVNSEDKTVLNTQPVAASVAGASSVPGDYAITVSGGSDNNYSFTYVGATLTVTSIVGIAQNSALKVKVYPNPFVSELFIDTENLSANAVANLYDLNGRKLMNIRLDGQAISLGHLTSGVYLLQVEGKSFRIVKQ